MKNKKGFTLIELLAIISILAIILLIAVPAISNVIETSRKNAFRDTALSVIKAAEFSYDLKKLENNVIEEITIDLGDKNDPNRGLIELKGEYPSGTVVIKDTGVVVVNITNGYFCATGTRDTLEIKKGDCEENFPIVVSNADDECFIVAGDSIIAYYAAEGYTCPTDLIIPSIIKGRRIKSITSLYNMHLNLGYTSFTSLTIPEGITRIEGNAQIHINNPSGYLYLPNSLEYIGSQNNFNMISVSNIVTENGFRYLKNSDGTTNKNVILSYEGTDTNLVIPSETKIILESTFDSVGLQSIDLSKTTNLIQIGSKAFAGNELTNVSIPSSVKYLAINSFSDNDNLTGLDIPNSINIFTKFNKIDDPTIYQENLIYEDSATNFVYLKKTDGTPDKRFLLEYKGSETDIIIDDEVTQILPHVFGNKDLTSVKLPDKLISIDTGAFSYNSLTNILIPDSVKYIHRSAFQGNQFRDVKIPNSVIYIGENAFDGVGLTSLTLGNSVAIIEMSAFANNQLTSINIPNSLAYIGMASFYKNNFTSITIPSTVDYIGSIGFSMNPFTEIIIKGDCNRFDKDWQFGNTFGVEISLKKCK